MIRHRNIMMVGLTLVVVSLTLVVSTLFAQEQTTPTLQCGDITFTDTQVTIPIIVDFAGEPFDSVRMEMLFETAILSSPTFQIGSDFDVVGAEGVADNLLVAVYGRSQTMPITESVVDFGTITFDWTGEPTYIVFNEGTRKTVALSIGDRTLIETTMCMVGENAPTPTPTITPTPTNTPTPTLTSTPTNTPAPTSTPTPIPLLQASHNIIFPNELVKYTITLTDTVASSPIVTATIPDGQTLHRFVTNSELEPEQSERQIIWRPLVDPALTFTDYPAQLEIFAIVDENAHEVFDVVTMTVEIDDGRTESTTLNSHYVTLTTAEIDPNSVDFDGLTIDDFPDTYEIDGVPDGLDFGDLPDTYSTSGEGAAVHAVTSDGSQIVLGNTISIEPDGQPGFGYDDVDEGVRYPGTFTAGNTQPIEILVSGDVPSEGALLGIWIDWNHDDQFSQEEFLAFNVTAGANIITATPPDDYEMNALAARFRLFSPEDIPGATLDWTDFEGAAVNGEVEDYIFAFATAPSVVEQFTTTHTSLLNGVALLGALLLLTAGVVRRGRAVS